MFAPELQQPRGQFPPQNQYGQPAGAMPLMPSAQQMNASGARTVMDGYHASQLPAAQQGLPLPAPGKTVVAGHSPMAAPSVPELGPKTMAVPGLPQPVQPKMNTMRIATPLGHTSRPPRRMWPIVLVIGLVLGLGGGGLAVFLSRKSDGSTDAGSSSTASGSSPIATGSSVATNAGTVSIDAGATVTPITVDAAVAAPDAAVAAASDAAVATASDAATAPDAAVATNAKTVRLTLDSQPQGAMVVGPDGTELGKTPLKTDWPSATAPVKFTFKLKGYRDKVKELTVTANMLTRVDLDRVPSGSPPKPPQGTGKGSAKPPRDNGVGNGLERPD
jgi:hypothetical protein